MSAISCTLDGKPLEKCTKAELIDIIQRLAVTNEELGKNNDEMRNMLKANAVEAEDFKLAIHNLIEENQNLWVVIRKGLDLKEMLDDAEDIAEDIRKALEKTKGDE